MNGSVLMHILIAIIPICGFVLIITPQLMPRDDFFAVTIPEDKATDTRLIAIRRRYTAIMTALTIIQTIIACWCEFLLINKTMSETAFAVAYLILFLALLLIGFAVMLVQRNKVLAIKKQEGWQIQPLQYAAGATQSEAPRPISLGWNLLYLPVLLLSAALALYLYPFMPDQIPMQVNLSGEVTRYAQKTILSALLSVWINIFMVVCFVVSHWALSRQKMPIGSKKSPTSAYAFGLYRRAMCVFTLVSGLLLTTSISIVIPLASVGLLTIMQGALILVIVAVIMVIGCIVLSLVYGQNGSRLLKNAEVSSTIVQDDDKYWKMGVFYVNQKDPAVFVSKRFGVGATVNLGNKVTWVVIIGFIAILCLFIALISKI